MKPVSPSIRSPLSALAGAGMLSLVLVAAGAVQDRIQVRQFPGCGQGLVRVAGIPTPQQMMRVEEGRPFVVPEGKLFVVIGLDLANLTMGYAVNLRFDSQVS